MLNQTKKGADTKILVTDKSMVNIESVAKFIGLVDCCVKISAVIPLDVLLVQTHVVRHCDGHQCGILGAACKPQTDHACDLIGRRQQQERFGQRSCRCTKLTKRTKWTSIVMILTFASQY